MIANYVRIKTVLEF